MADSARAHLIFSFRKVLRPLIKILIRAGVTYDEFREVIKGAYVETAVREGVGQPGPITRERVATYTGVPPGDVDRFVDDESLLAPPDATNADVIAEVLAHLEYGSELSRALTEFHWRSTLRLRRVEI